MTQQLVILSGLSGSGKTTVLQTLEDIGYYCVDNLPISMLPSLCQTLSDDTPAKHIAVSIDVRNSTQDFSSFGNTLSIIQKDMHYRATVVFLDAVPSSLIRRFNETRRKHPLQKPDMSLEDAISAERHQLEHIIQAANIRLDTSEDNVHALRDRIRHLFNPDEHDNRLLIRLNSFGFKHGAPSDADFVFDARHLPNPHWESALRELTGQHEKIVEFLETYPLVIQYRDDINHFFQQWIPRLDDGKRHYLTIAIGCTGGKHRSVYLVESLAKSLSPLATTIVVSHRDCEMTKNHIYQSAPLATALTETDTTL